MPNSSSKRITSSTVSSESAPRSSINRALGVTSFSSTPSSSTIICFTLASISGSGIRLLLFQMYPTNLVSRLLLQRLLTKRQTEVCRTVPSSQVLTRSAQTGLVLHIKTAEFAVDLPRESAQNFSRADFNQGLYTLLR